MIPRSRTPHWFVRKIGFGFSHHDQFSPGCKQKLVQGLYLDNVEFPRWRGARRQRPAGRSLWSASGLPALLDSSARSKAGASSRTPNASR
jgi:hypothetical protein